MVSFKKAMIVGFYWNHIKTDLLLLGEQLPMEFVQSSLKDWQSKTVDW